MLRGSMSTSGSYRSEETGIANVPAGAWFAMLGEYTVTAGRLAASCAWSAEQRASADKQRAISFRAGFIRGDR